MLFSPHITIFITAGNASAQDCGMAFLPARNANMENMNAIHGQTFIIDRLA